MPIIVSDSSTNLPCSASLNTPQSVDSGSSSNIPFSVVLSSLIAVVNLTHMPTPVNNEQPVDEIVEDTATYCQKHNILSPVAVLRYFQ